MWNKCAFVSSEHHLYLPACFVQLSLCLQCLPILFSLFLDPSSFSIPNSHNLSLPFNDSLLLLLQCGKLSLKLEVLCSLNLLKLLKLSDFELVLLDRLMSVHEFIGRSPRGLIHLLGLKRVLFSFIFPEFNLS